MSQSSVRVVPARVLSVALPLQRGVTLIRVVLFHLFVLGRLCKALSETAKAILALVTIDATNEWGRRHTRGSAIRQCAKIQTPRIHSAFPDRS